VGTATFINPTATTDIVDGLESYMKENKVQKLSELIGTARR
jgi:dihydroorotate dehydrogenase (NAD+) catalytic subunit